MNDNEGIGQISLFDQELDFLAELSARDGWPDPTEFPFNQKKTSVGSIVQADLKASADPLIVTGYTSLDRLIRFCSKIGTHNTSIRILLGSEPYDTQRTDFFY